jgi:hypothetical protein
VNLPELFLKLTLTINLPAGLMFFPRIHPQILNMIDSIVLWWMINETLNTNTPPLP